MSKGYKLVIKLGEGVYGSISPFLYPSATRYLVGSITTQDPDTQGPFAVFDNLQLCILFGVTQQPYVSDDLHLFWVEYTPSPAEDLWHEGINFRRHKLICPKGTDFASTVTLLKQVEFSAPRCRWWG